MTHAVLVWIVVLLGSIIVIITSHSKDKDDRALSVIIAFGLVLLAIYGVEL